MLKYVIFDFDWTLVNSMKDTVKLVVDELTKIDKNLDEDYIRYVFKTTMWMSLKEQLKILFPNKMENEISDFLKKLYDKLWALKYNLFPGAKEVILNLSKDYQLFITTWNSTQAVKKTLSRENLLDYFSLILGSDKLLKWPEHINEFKYFTWDDEFEKKAIYIWDWNIDYQIAKKFGIKFVKIKDDEEGSYDYVIDNIADLLSLDIFKWKKL